MSFLRLLQKNRYFIALFVVGSVCLFKHNTIKKAFTSEKIEKHTPSPKKIITRFNLHYLNSNILFNGNDCLIFTLRQTHDH